MCGTVTIARLWAIRVLLAALMVLVLGAVASAEDPTIVQVEEDWELVIGSADPASGTPQILCVMSPTGDVESAHAVLELNYRSQPGYSPGGMQIQLWRDDAMVRSRQHPRAEVMETPGEVVTWTTSMRLDDQGLVFEVLNGHSVTWGEFGGEGYLKITDQTDLADLAAFSPDVSVANSGIVYAHDRVASFVLKRVRYISDDGQTMEVIMDRSLVERTP